MSLDHKTAITDPLLMKQSLALISLVILAFVFADPLGIMPGTIALGGATVLMFLDNTKGNKQLMALVILLSSAVLDAIVDNIPFVAAMISLVDGKAPTFGGEEAIRPL
jgi:Na+/H+ antiporter NhaD/arsenite permease-like protein